MSDATAYLKDGVLVVEVMAKSPGFYGGRRKPGDVFDMHVGAMKRPPSSKDDPDWEFADDMEVVTGGPDALDIWLLPSWVTVPSDKARMQLAQTRDQVFNSGQHHSRWRKQDHRKVSLDHR